MAKADLAIARLYASLVREDDLRDRVWLMLADEFERTRRVILRITGQSELLRNNAVLSRSIRLRNPYVRSHELDSGRIAEKETGSNGR